MKKAHLYGSLMLLLWACLCLPLNAVAQTELQQKMKAISNITEVKDLECEGFAEKYVVKFT